MWQNDAVLGTTLFIFGLILAWLWMRVGGRPCLEKGCSGTMFVSMILERNPAPPRGDGVLTEVTFEQCDVCGAQVLLDERLMNDSLSPNASLDPKGWVEARFYSGT